MAGENTAKEKALLFSLKNTEARADRVAQEIEATENRTTVLAIFQGVDAATGKAMAKTVRDDVIFFDLITSSVPKIGEAIEVAIAHSSLYGRGDKRPVK
jgi:hypothetical protein